jgi:hypothetical protein
MILHLLPLAAGLALAVPQTPAKASPEETLRVELSKLRQKRATEVREAMLGAADELRDAVATSKGEEKNRLATRLPGMAQDPFGLCRDLKNCEQAPRSLHVEDEALVDDAFMALARPWFNLQKARDKAVKVVVDPGVGVKLELEDFAARPSVTLEASPTPTGGFDVSLDEAEQAAKDYAAGREAVLSPTASR